MPRSAYPQQYRGRPRPRICWGQYSMPWMSLPQTAEGQWSFTFAFPHASQMTGPGFRGIGRGRYLPSSNKATVQLLCTLTGARNGKLWLSSCTVRKDDVEVRRGMSICHLDFSWLVVCR